MSGLANWRSNMLAQQHQLAQQQLAQHQLAQQEQLVKYQQAQQQLAQQQQKELQTNYDSPATQTFTITGSTVYINGPSQITMTDQNAVNNSSPVSMIGYFQYNYGTIPVTNIPSGVNTAVAFTGWADPATALSDSLAVYGGLQGDKYISLGGGAAPWPAGSGGPSNCQAGAFTRANLQSIYTAINAGQFSNYIGILFDIEYVLGLGLYAPSGTNTRDSFQEVFAAAKANKLMVIVCVGHSGNIGITDSTYNVWGVTQDTKLLPACFKDNNVDYISPQLYSNGNEDPPQYNVNGLPWSAWASSGKPIIAAIPWAQQYSEVVVWAQTQGMALNGFIQWYYTRYPKEPAPPGNFNINVVIQNNSKYMSVIIGITSTSNLKPMTVPPGKTMTTTSNSNGLNNIPISYSGINTVTNTNGSVLGTGYLSYNDAQNASQEGFGFGIAYPTGILSAEFDVFQKSTGTSYTGTWAQWVCNQPNVVTLSPNSILTIIFNDV